MININLETSTQLLMMMMMMNSITKTIKCMIVVKRERILCDWFRGKKTKCSKRRSAGWLDYERRNIFTSLVPALRTQTNKIHHFLQNCRKICALFGKATKTFYLPGICDLLHAYFWISSVSCFSPFSYWSWN